MLAARQNDVSVDVERHIVKLDIGGMSVMERQVNGKVARPSQTDNCGSCKDIQNIVVSNLSVECTWRDCLAAYYYLSVVESLVHARRHNGEFGNVSDGDPSTNHQSSSDKPSMEVCVEAGSPGDGVEVCGVAGDPGDCVEVCGVAGSPSDGVEVCGKAGSPGDCVEVCGVAGSPSDGVEVCGKAGSPGVAGSPSDGVEVCGVAGSPGDGVEVCGKAGSPGDGVEVCGVAGSPGDGVEVCGMAGSPGDGVKVCGMAGSPGDGVEVCGKAGSPGVAGSPGDGVEVCGLVGSLGDDVEVCGKAGSSGDGVEVCGKAGSSGVVGSPGDGVEVCGMAGSPGEAGSPGDGVGVCGKAGISGEAGSSRPNDYCQKVLESTYSVGVVRNDPSDVTCVGNGTGSVCVLSVADLCEIARHLLWDVHATRCQLAAAWLSVQRAVCAQTGKGANLRLTALPAATILAENDPFVDDTVVEVSDRFARELSGEYIPMTSCATNALKLRHPHELIVMSPVKSGRSLSFPSSPTLNDTIEEFEEMSPETDVCSSQCAHDELPSLSVEQTQTYTQATGVFPNEPVEAADTVLAKSLGLASDENAADGGGDVASLPESRCQVDTSALVVGFVNHKAAAESEYIAVNGEVDASKPLLNGRQTSGRPDLTPECTNMEASAGSHCPDMPDEWYGLPPDVRYTQSGVTLSQLKQEGTRITQQLQLLPSGVKVMSNWQF